MYQEASQPNIYLENYGMYKDFVINGNMSVRVSDITRENWEQHFMGVLNIMRDCIDTELVNTNGAQHFITVDFCTGNPDHVVDLTIIDYWYNLTMWYLPLKASDEAIAIKPWHIFFETDGIKTMSIKKYIDKHFLQKYRTTIENIVLNRSIDECLVKLKHIDEFSLFLANTINLEDFRDLRNMSEEFRAATELTLENKTPEEVKTEGDAVMNRAIEIIKNSEHCLSPFFRAGEGVNAKQFKEFAINIGNKPDGRGGIYPVPVNKNFLSTGVNDLTSFTIEASTGRTAQIMLEENVGDSGHFARVLGLNNMDTFIHSDPNYTCNTVNFQRVLIKSNKYLDLFDNRYYRLTQDGMEYRLDASRDTHLIGQVLHFRSPMTCASAARGEGICYKCYGDLAHTNKDINIGKIAAELLSAELTQMMLSAKHLLEASIKSVNWSEGFSDIFDINYNTISFKNDETSDFNKWKMILDPDEIYLEVENDDDSDMEVREYNEYIYSFEMVDPSGNSHIIKTEDGDEEYTGEKIYISSYLNGIIRDYARPANDKIVLDISTVLKEEGEMNSPLFIVKILNNDLSRTLDRIQSTVDKKSVVEQFDRHMMLEELLDSAQSGGLKVYSSHAEVILSNQIRASESNILNKPQWEFPDEEYTLLPLKKALKNNPSVTISASFEWISRMLYDPLTYKKNKASFMDLFFMESPQTYVSKSSPYAEDGLIYPITYTDTVVE